MLPQKPCILVVGADGVIGSALINHIKQLGKIVVGTTRRNQNSKSDRIFLDLALPCSFASLISQEYEAVFICGAITSLQECAADPINTRLVNVYGTKSLIDLLAKKDVPIIYISTNLVFDGSSPYIDAQCPVCPKTEYGVQKVKVEKYLRSKTNNYIIARFGKVLHPTHQLINGWIENLRANNKVYPYKNKFIAPISLQTAIKILYWLYIEQAKGTYQATASSEITYADAAYITADLLKCDQSLIKPVDSLDLISAPIEYTTLKTSHAIREKFGKLCPKIAIKEAVMARDSKDYV